MFFVSLLLFIIFSAPSAAKEDLQQIIKADEQVEIKIQ